MRQTELFQMLSDQTRLRALMLMKNAGALCVCELMHALQVSQPKISRHMASLRKAGLVTSRRHAQWVFYGISHNLPGWQSQVLSGAFNGIASEAVVKQDISRLGKMKDRPPHTFAA